MLVLYLSITRWILGIKLYLFLVLVYARPGKAGELLGILFAQIFIN